MITYFIQVSLIWIALYVVYATLLHKETFFNANRLYLLLSLGSGVLVPAIVPLLSFDSQTVAVPLGTYIATMNEIIIQPEVTAKPWYESPPQLMLGLYLMGIFILAVKFISGLAYIWHIYRKSNIEPKSGYTLVTTLGNHQPFSFFGYVFVTKKNLTNPNIDEIIKHEIIHIREGHSIDIMCLEVIQILFWFNPILILYKRSLRAAHEYMADQGMIQTCAKDTYSLLLLGYTSSGDDVALVNPFFNSLIKKRIQMMYAKKSDTSAKIKYFAALPIVTFLTIALASYEVNGQTITNTIEDKLTKIVTRTATDTIVDVDYQTKEERIKIVQNIAKDTIKEKLPQDVLFVVDDKIVSQVQNIKPDNISTINVLKGDQATTKYGVKGKNGVVEITTKTAVPIISMAEADTQPRFPGCKSAEESQSKLMTFLGNNIKYPASARKYGVEGKVIVSFVISADDFEVNPKGSIKDIKILHGISPDCDAEVIRVIEKMRDEHGQWIPATKDGEFVTTQFTLPVRFKLDPSIDARTIKVDNLDVTFYPSPATDFIMVGVKEKWNGVKIELRDLNGKIVKFIQHSGTGLQEINTSDLPAGEYILVASKDKASTTEKILIVR